MKIYIAKNGVQLGPYNESQLTDQLKESKISYDDLGWVDGMSEWLPLSKFIQPPAGSPPPIPQKLAESTIKPQDSNDDIQKGNEEENQRGGNLGPAIFWFIAISVGLGVYFGVDDNNKKNQPDSEASANEASANKLSGKDSTTHTNGGGEKKTKIGEVVKFPDSEWTVIEARNIGNTLSSVLENKHTSGSFISVKFSVINKTNEEEQILETPQLVDSKGRKFKQMDDCALYLPEGANEMTLEQRPAGLSKTFYAIFEVPLDAAKLSFQARSLGFSPEYALIDIGL